MPKDNPALKALVHDFDGFQPPTPARMKKAQEALEAAIVQRAREIVHSGPASRSVHDHFTALLKLYESQPNLNIRTSTTVTSQEYTKSAPLAYRAGWRASTPGGRLRAYWRHGMLVIGAGRRTSS